MYPTLHADLQNAPLGAILVDALMQPLSQIQECNNAPGDGSNLSEFNIDTPYSPVEIDKLFEGCVSTSEDLLHLFEPTTLER